VSEDEKRVAVAVKRVFLAVAGVAPAAAAAMGGEHRAGWMRCVGTNAG